MTEAETLLDMQAHLALTLESLSIAIRSGKPGTIDHGKLSPRHHRTFAQAAPTLDPLGDAKLLSELIETVDRAASWYGRPDRRLLPITLRPVEADGPVPSLVPPEVDLGSVFSSDGRYWRIVSAEPSDQCRIFNVRPEE